MAGPIGAGLVEETRAVDLDASYREVIGGVLDYRSWARAEDPPAPPGPK